LLPLLVGKEEEYMEVLAANEERVVLRKDDGAILVVNNLEFTLKKYGKKFKFDFEDLIAMSLTLRFINDPRRRRK